MSNFEIETKKLNRPIQSGFHLIFMVTFGFTFFAVVFMSLASPESIKQYARHSDKILHFCAYLGISFLALGAFPKQKLRSIFLGLSATGIVIEILQASMELGRTASAGDILANCMGIATPILIWITISITIYGK